MNSTPTNSANPSTNRICRNTETPCTEKARCSFQNNKSTKPFKRPKERSGGNYVPSSSSSTSAAPAISGSTSGSSLRSAAAQRTTIINTKQERSIVRTIQKRTKRANNRVSVQRRRRIRRQTRTESIGLEYSVGVLDSHQQQRQKRAALRSDSARICSQSVTLCDRRNTRTRKLCFFLQNLGRRREARRLQMLNNER